MGERALTERDINVPDGGPFGFTRCVGQGRDGTGQVNGDPRIPQNPSNKRAHLTQGADEGGRGM